MASGVEFALYQGQTAIEAEASMPALHQHCVSQLIQTYYALFLNHEL
jgi:hypothetical protein